MSNKFKKKYILPITTALAALSFTMSASAAQPGAYLGGQLGWSNVHQGNYSKTYTDTLPDIGVFSYHVKETDRGLAGRIFGGYQFNDYVAAELGYTRFHNGTQSLKITSSVSEPFDAIKGTLKTDAFDLVAKGILPLPNNFNVYGKLGVAYLRATETVRIYDLDGTRSKYSDSAHDFYPTFSAGVGYDLTKNISADVSWNRIQKVGGNTTLPSTDFFAAGLAYHFG